MTIQDQNKLKVERKDWKNIICTNCEINKISNPMGIAFTYENCECEECASIPEYLK